MKNIVFIYRTARKPNLERYKLGLEPDHLLYGFNHLLKEGLGVKFSDIAYRKLNFLYWIFFPIQYFFIQLTSFGFKIDQAILLYPLIRRNKIIVSTADSAGLPILLFKKMGLINSRIVYISTGFINELKKRKQIFIIKFFYHLLNYADRIICHSNIEKKTYLEKTEINKNNIHVIPFGIDRNFFKTQTESENYILSIGRDRSRDFKLLKNAAKVLKKECFILVTSRPNTKNIKFPSNVKIFYDIPYIEVKKLYMNAKLVLIPLKEINRASGQISFLESIAMNKKIVVANVKGLGEVYKKLIGVNKNIFLYRSGDQIHAVKQIKRAIRWHVIEFELHKKYDSFYYAEKLKKILKDL